MSRNVLYSHPVTPDEYVKLVLPEQEFSPAVVNKMMSADELRELLDDNGLSNLWDYPLDEIDHIVENDLNVVLVVFDTGCVTKREWRWFEFPPKN